MIMIGRFTVLKAHMLTEVTFVQHTTQFLVNQYTDALNQSNRDNDR